MSGRAMNGQPKYRVEIFWSEEDGGYIANIPELKYTSAFGETREEALREVLVAEELHLETLEELGRPIPEPKIRQAEEDKLPTELVTEITFAQGADPATRTYAEVLSHGSNALLGIFVEGTEDEDTEASYRVVDDESLKRLVLN